MSQIEDLTAAIDGLIADQKKFIEDVKAAIATMLENGIHPAALEALLAKVTAADEAVNAADASLKS